MPALSDRYLFFVAIECVADGPAQLSPGRFAGADFSLAARCSGNGLGFGRHRSRLAHPVDRDLRAPASLKL
jgi:hypothetical protein